MTSSENCLCFKEFCNAYRYDKKHLHAARLVLLSQSNDIAELIMTDRDVCDLYREFLKKNSDRG